MGDCFDVTWEERQNMSAISKPILKSLAYMVQGMVEHRTVKRAHHRLCEEYTEEVFDGVLMPRRQLTRSLSVFSLVDE